MFGARIIPSQTQLDARRRAMIALAAFGAGIWLALRLPGPLPLFWFSLASIAAALALALRARDHWPALALALGLLGSAASAAHLGPWPVDALATKLPGPDEVPVLIEVEGLVTSEPTVIEPPVGAMAAFIPVHMERNARQRFDLSLRRVRTGETWSAASGVLSVWVDLAEEQPIGVRPGTALRVTGTASALPSPANPGERDRTLQNRDDGRAGHLFTTPGLAEVIDLTSPADRFLARLLVLRSRVQSPARGIIERASRGDPVAGPVMRGLILGVTGRDEQDVSGAFRRVGLLHLLAVSGFHVAVAAALALLAIRVTGDRGRLEPVIVCAALGLYVLVVPMQAPIFRSAAMVLAMLAGDALGRRHDRIAVLAWIAVLWLALRPSDLFDLGFQLSFGVTGWLIVLGEPRRGEIPALNEPTRAEAARLLTKRWLGTHASSWSVALPLAAHHTGIVSTLAVAASVVTVPMIVLAMWLGFALLAVGAVAPGLEGPLASALRAVSGLAARTALWFDGVPLASLRLPGASAAWTLGATFSAVWIWRRAHLCDWRWAAIVLALAGWLALERTFAMRTQGEEASVHALAVGDGSAYVIRSGGEAALWDAGSWRPDVGRRLIPEACRAMGVPRAEVAFITHANIDHYMGLLDAAGPMGVRTVVTGESFLRAAESDPGSAPAFVLSELARLGATHRVAVAGDVFEIGGARLTILHPPAGFVPRAENDASLVAMLEAPSGGRVLLTGDIQREAMAVLLESGADLSADAIELPHHGSAHEAAYEFVRRVDPRVVLQSTGRQRLDDPRWDPLRQGRYWLVTQRHGMSSVHLMVGGGVRAESFR